MPSKDPVHERRRQQNARIHAEIDRIDYELAHPQVPPLDRPIREPYLRERRAALEAQVRYEKKEEPVAEVASDIEVLPWMS